MMKKLIARIYQFAFFLTMIFLPALSFAAEERVNNAEATKYTPPSWSSYMLAYMLVVLCIGLALLVICTPVHRRDKPLQKD